MTPHMKLDEKAVEAAQIVAREGCGLTIDGQHVFCDDPIIGDATDAYGDPLRRSTCSCKQDTARIITAYLSHAPQGGVRVSNSMNEVLDLIEEYFDSRADADQEPGDSYPVGNEEMGLLTQLRRERALSSLPASQDGENADG